ncbi:glycoside hydrolase superfamily [Lipomyces orientalis]|uniref:Glycoside hydrolase superfamily n=1 Tax=Lipomyces orientalis TaxID=1233043 RepID=A0ACC3TFD7_9ASCO
MKFSTIISATVILLLRQVLADDTIRGVNVGGWLILEQWLGGDIWNDAPDASDEYTFCQTLGQESALSALQNHWSTWFTEDTVKELASYGVNALRIPIGYWSVIADQSQPYVMGAIDYLDLALGWAENAGIKVWIDLHGIPGSQNGFDNSGHAGSVEWQTNSDNIPSTVKVLQALAEKYSDSKYSDVVAAIELINEPISWAPNDVSVTRQFYIDAYAAVREAMTDNKDLPIIMHDSFVELSYWSDMPSTVGSSYGQLGLDTHIYQVFTDEFNSLDGKGHISAACDYQYSLQTSNDILPTYAGEWSAAAEICVYSDGTSAPGTSCSQDGCQCTTDDSANWNDNLKGLVRAFVEAQMDVFEGNGTGYFFWSHTGPGAWNFINGVQQGWIPQPLTDRQYPGQCGFELKNGDSDDNDDNDDHDGYDDGHSNSTWHHDGDYHRRVRRGRLGRI